MPDLGIIFGHINTDEATRVNLESFRRWHPEGPVITVSGGSEIFEGGHVAKDFKLWDHKNGWYNSDYLFYHGYLSRNADCKRWLFVEWDCFCNMPVRDFLRYVWDFDVAPASVRLQNREPGWPWFQEIPKLPARLRPFAMGVVPLNGTMVSDHAMSKIVNVVLQEPIPVFCELRIGTVGNLVGCPAMANPNANSITWIPYPKGQPLPAGVWHPVKYAMKDQTG